VEVTIYFRATHPSERAKYLYRCTMDSATEAQFHAVTDATRRAVRCKLWFGKRDLVCVTVCCILFLIVLLSSIP
jgi:hypothetical protein